jgi:hypothetical protein
MIWVQAPDIRGHELIVDRFKRSSDIPNLPENYVITSDLYWANYKRHTQKSSDISRTMPYVPRRGTLIEASKLGRDEPHIFYKVLAKKNWDGTTKGNIYQTPCDFLCVRTNKKQIYKTVHKVKMFVEKQYHDTVHKICSLREETKAQANARLFVMQDKMAMKTQFQFIRSITKAQRISISQYEARQRREYRLKRATPNWSDKSAIDKLRMDVRKRNKEAGGIFYHLDHVIPLYAVDTEGNHVACGLHVSENLEIISAKENLSKSNKLQNHAEPSSLCKEQNHVLPKSNDQQAKVLPQILHS